MLAPGEPPVAVIATLIRLLLHRFPPAHAIVMVGTVTDAFDILIALPETLATTPVTLTLKTVLDVPTMVLPKIGAVAGVRDADAVWAWTTDEALMTARASPRPIRKVLKLYLRPSL